MFILQIHFETYKNLKNNYFQSLFQTLQKFFSLNRKSWKPIKYLANTKKFILLKSPHVNKKSREQFQFEIFRNKIYLSHSNIYLLADILLFLKKTTPSNIRLKIQLKYVYSLTRKKP